MLVLMRQPEDMTDEELRQAVDELFREGEKRHICLCRDPECSDQDEETLPN